jgi:Ca2+-binding RTX toxin-like protein
MFMRGALAAAAMFAGALALPGIANATTVTDDSQFQLSVTGGLGQENNVSVSYEANRVVFKDPARITSTLTTCTRPVATDLTTIACAIDPAANATLQVDLSDENDALTVSENGGNVDYLYVGDGPGDDKVTIKAKAKTYYLTGPGDDVYKGGPGVDLMGPPYKDEYGYTYDAPVGAGNDKMFGFGGNDIMRGGDGNDTMFGGIGNDTLSGSKGNDRLFGEAGNDYLKGGFGNDFLKGGPGTDKLLGEQGRNTLIQ